MDRMDAKTAVKHALTHVADIFEPQGIRNLYLEELEHNEIDSEWRITVGFVRGSGGTFAGIAIGPARIYKIVRLDDHSGEVKSVKNGPASAD